MKLQTIGPDVMHPSIRAKIEEVARYITRFAQIMDVGIQIALHNQTLYVGKFVHVEIKKGEKFTAIFVTDTDLDDVSNVWDCPLLETKRAALRAITRELEMRLSYLRISVEREGQ